jgi:hypothetical protein
MLHTEFEPRRGEDLQQKALREAAVIKELEQIMAELRLLERDAQTPGGG